MAIKLGMHAKMYYGPAGATATNELGNTKDVTLSLETGEADVTVRKNGGWRAFVATLKNGTVEFEMIWDTDDAAFIAIQDAWLNSTALAFAILDGENGHGLDADFAVTNFTRNEPLEEAITVNVTIKPTYSTRAPAWI
jgi:hypothetical protein